MQQNREDLVSAAWEGGQVERLGRGRKRNNSESENDEWESVTNGHNGGTVKRRVTAFSRLDTSNQVVGLIDRVHLENFMVHSNLIWEPNPCVNFVTGQNGSGKSSVLQGLVLGLMGESKHIKRYSKVKDFIKRDCSKAVIQVTLKNMGECAYKPEVYGSSITFQRTIFDTGTSFFALKDENMKDVHKKSKVAKEECRRILEKFQIQVDSPIVILQQDEAKELLRVESPSQLYSFFEKATLLKQCLDIYKSANAEYNRAEATLKEKSRVLRDIRSQVVKSQSKYEEIIRSQEMSEELKTAKGEYAWARVHSARENSIRLQDNLEKLTERLTQPKARLMGLHEKFAEMKLHKTELEVALEDETSKFGSQENELTGLKDELDRLKKDLKTKNANLKTENTHKNSLIQETRVIREQLEVMAASEQKLDRRQREEQIRLTLLNLEKKRRGLEDQINQEGQARELVEQNIRTDIEKEGMVDSEIRSKKERKVALIKEIEELEGASEQHLAVFGSKIPLVDRAIKKNLNRFKRPPVGPVGSFVKLKGEAATNPELARLVETELSRAQLTAYLTNHDDDRRTMAKILDEVYGTDWAKPRIFTSKFLFKKHNIQRPNTHEPVLLDYIQVDNAVVFNHLVDQKSIESVIICRTQDDAKTIMTRREKVPAHSSYAITHDFYRFFPPRENTSYRSYYMEPLTGSGMLRATMSNLVKERNEELLGLSAHISDLEEEKQEVVRSRKSYEAEKKRAMAEIQSLRSQVASINSQMSQVKSEEVGGVEDADNLRARLITRKTELAASDEKIKDLVTEKEMLSNLLKDKEELFKETKKKLNELKSAANPILKDLRELENKISSKSKEMMNQEMVMKNMRTEIDNLKLELKKNDEEEKQFAQTARKMTQEEIFPDKTVKQLNARIVQLKKRISIKNEVSQDTQQFLKEHSINKQRYEEMRSHINRLHSLLENIAKLQKERELQFSLIQKVVSENVRRKFNMLFSKFSKQIGSEIFLRIDNKRKELRFTHYDDGNRKSTADITTLSGGEKSFTQMCLICSLWEVMQPPFRCLDEWDVYLDSVNRKTITAELLKFSLNNKNKQFIFISPQGACDLSSVDHGVVSVTEIKKS